MGHRNGTMDFDHLMFEGGNGYQRQRAYGRSKLANLLFTFELQQHFEAFRSDAMATAAHPGGANTNLARSLEKRWYFRLFRPFMGALAQSPAMGAFAILASGY